MLSHFFPLRWDWWSNYFDIWSSNNMSMLQPYSNFVWRHDSVACETLSNTDSVIYMHLWWRSSLWVRFSSLSLARLICFSDGSFFDLSSALKRKMLGSVDRSFLSFLTFPALPCLWKAHVIGVLSHVPGCGWGWATLQRRKAELGGWGEENCEAAPAHE